MNKIKKIILFMFILLISICACQKENIQIINADCYYYEYLQSQREEKYVYIVCFCLELENNKEIQSLNIIDVKNFKIISHQLDDEEKGLMDKFEVKDDKKYFYYVLSSNSDISHLNQIIVNINGYKKVVDIGILGELAK